MTAWALLLLVSTLLHTPGLSSSEYYDQALRGPSDGDPSCQGLIQEDLQDELLTKSGGLRITCGLCKRIIHTLKSLVGSQLNEYTIAQAASHVCGRMGLLRIPCSYIMRNSLRIISEDLIEGKDARDICVDLKMCISLAASEYAHKVLLSPIQVPCEPPPWGRPRKFQQPLPAPSFLSPDSTLQFLSPNSRY